ncbi:MAG TPA: ABC transporter substrate-binding protein, partial [Casimicrobiaceae bacterium]
MKRSTLWSWFIAVAATALSSATLAQAPVEISFYYPVAVGGPITKLVDNFAADFEK